MRGLSLVLAAIVAIAFEAPSARAEPRALRVCADPNNLPFSNAKGEGFENRIVELIARDLDADVSYSWWAQRRGFARNTLKAGLCDLWAGVALGVKTLATTEPYYRSTYAFVSRVDRDLDISSFDDPRLKALRIGVQMIGNDATNTPPAHALARRGLASNVRGFMVYGDYAQADPEAAIVEAVARGEIDIAVVWGPVAGYFADQAQQPLKVTPVSVPEDGGLPMAFDIAMGVGKTNAPLRAEIDAALARERPAIDRILADYHVVRARP